MPCDVPCDKCPHLDKCGGEVEEGPAERFCNSTCSHFDEINQCCWQAGEWGLCFTVCEDDLCHLGYKGDSS
jgi:hypothetical protein